MSDDTIFVGAVVLSILLLTVVIVDTTFIYPDAAHQAVAACEDKYNTSIVTHFDRKPFTTTPLGVQCLTADIQVRGLEELLR